MDALAERAHAGKATIYRHWSGKAQVVAEAVLRLKGGGASTALCLHRLAPGDLLAALDQIAARATESTPPSSPA